MINKKQKRESKIPDAGIADIAFLLLVFFLVVTTIDVDTGIGMTLPPPLPEDSVPPEVKNRNMLAVLVNNQGELLIEGQLAVVNDLRAEVVKHTLNRGVDPTYAESPEKAIVSLKTERETPYAVYVSVLDQIMLGYRDIWDSEARTKGFSDYTSYKHSIGKDGDDEIRDQFPTRISLAEPE
jgi:biopolymer transport protein ExbD